MYSLNIIEILKLGLIGLAFLLALLIYLLLSREQKKNIPNEKMLSEIKKFRGTVILLIVVIGIFNIFELFVNNNTEIGNKPKEDHAQTEKSELNLEINNKKEEVFGFLFELIKCDMSSSTLTINCQLINKRNDRLIYILKDTRLYIDGNEYYVDFIRLGSQKVRRDHIGNIIPKNVPIRLDFIFENVSKKNDLISLLEISFEQGDPSVLDGERFFKAQIRDIKII
jgi:hypothetical protein